MFRHSILTSRGSESFRQTVLVWSDEGVTPQYASASPCELLERLSVHHWKSRRPVRRSAHGRKWGCSFPPSDDQVEESNLADGLDVTSKAWQVVRLSRLSELRSLNPIQTQFHVPYMYCGCPLQVSRIASCECLISHCKFRCPGNHCWPTPGSCRFCDPIQS